MGYSTEFYGQFDVTPALSEPQIAYLRAFNETRRMARNPTVAATLPDPKREAAGLPIGPQGGYFVGASGDFGQDSDASVLDYNQSPKDQPGLWCQWVPTDDGNHIEWDGGEKFYEYQKWLEYIISNFLKPWGCTLNGCVTWEGEDEDDQGALGVVDNTVKIFAERIDYEATVQHKTLKSETDAIANSKTHPPTLLKI